jgi:cytoskeletal protein RodZ
MSDRENALHAPDGSLGIGSMLEQARKDRGLSLSEVEQATKIRKRYLQGLERDDYAALPDAIYARGFLKTYANFLGLDGEHLAWQLKTRRAPRRERLGGTGVARSSDFDKPLISPGGLGGTEKRLISGGTVLALAVGLIALTAVIGTLYYIGRGSQTATEDATPSQQAAEDGSSGDGSANPEGGSENAPDDAQGNTPSGGAEDAPQEDAGGDEPAAQPDVLRAVVEVEGAPSWLQIRSDGEVALEQVAQPGFSQTFEAEEKITIYTGNAGAVSVEINGQDVGTLGENGEVLTRDFNLKAGT